MEDDIKDELNWRSPSGLKAAMEDLAAHTDTYRQLLTDSSGTVPSAELVGALYAADAKTRRLLELIRRGYGDDTEVGGPETHRQDESWRGQESGRSDDVSNRERYHSEVRRRKAAAQAFKAGKAKARRSRRGRRK